MQKNETGLYEATVDGKTYEFEKWNAEDSLQTLLDIAAVLGAPIGAIADHLKSKDAMHQEVAQSALDDVVSRLSTQLVTNRDMVMGVIRKLGAYKMFCDGKAVNFKQHYADDLGHLFRVVRQNAEVQYGNFFGALGGRAAPLLAQLRNQGANRPAASAPQA